MTAECRAQPPRELAERSGHSRGLGPFPVRKDNLLFKQPKVMEMGKLRMMGMIPWDTYVLHAG